jgi:hypothetical protein
MKKIAYLLITFVLLTAFDHAAYGQMNRRSIKKNNKRIGNYKGRKSHFDKNKVYNALGISLNAFNYYGDLSPSPKALSTDLSLTRPAIGVSFVHRFGPRYQLVGSFMYGGIRGSDNESADKDDEGNGVFRYNRNLSFRNRIKELSIVGQVDLFDNQSTYISRVKWTPYIYAGLAVFHHNPQAQVPDFQVDGVTPFSNAGEWVALQPLGTEGQNADLLASDVNHGLKPYKRIQFAIPFGFGARFRLNEVMDISGEFGFRYTFTDYLDDVSGNYVDLGVFGNDELAKAMSYRTNEVASFNRTYVGRDGQTYNVLTGYGEEYGGGTPEDPGNVRGNSDDKDIYMVTTIRLTYILGKTFHRAKFR